MAQDKGAYIHKRKKRYMAIILDHFDAEIAPHLPADVADEHRGLVRQKLHALALDSIEIIALKPGVEINGHAVELRDALSNGHGTTTTRSH